MKVFHCARCKGAFEYVSVGRYPKYCSECTAIMEALYNRKYYLDQRKYSGLRPDEIAESERKHALELAENKERREIKRRQFIRGFYSQRDAYSWKTVKKTHEQYERDFWGFRYTVALEVEYEISVSCLLCASLKHGLAPENQYYSRPEIVCFQCGYVRGELYALPYELSFNEPLKPDGKEAKFSVDLFQPRKKPMIIGPFKRDFTPVWNFAKKRMLPEAVARFNNEWIHGVNLWYWCGDHEGRKYRGMNVEGIPTRQFGQRQLNMIRREYKEFLTVKHYDDRNFEVGELKRLNGKRQTLFDEGFHYLSGEQHGIHKTRPSLPIKVSYDNMFVDYCPAWDSTRLEREMHGVGIEYSRGDCTSIWDDRHGRLAVADEQVMDANLKEIEDECDLLRDIERTHDYENRLFQYTAVGAWVLVLYARAQQHFRASIRN